ncbi:hypothetical protein RN001_001438 [Aquatica leii]|uniref:FYVE-type domain-containing protein n=1 Tax=Aquatica leii TaxID=1421715 RepID=A0AAN7SJK3_9COLE|nr:hypothetical protein RN001_001438 [Aquatica leii]
MNFSEQFWLQLLKYQAMGELQCLINTISSNKEFLPTHIKRFYHLLSQIAIDEIDKDNLLPKIYSVIKHKAVRKDLMFIALLVNNDKKVISGFIDYEKSLIKLDLTDPMLLYDYCLFTNKHWVLDIAQNDTTQNSVFTQNALTIFSYLQLIYRTNEQHINLKSIYDILGKVQPSSNEFMNRYMQYLNKALDIVQLCKKYLESENDSQVSEIYYYASNNVILNVFSKFLDLRSFNICEEILFKLNNYNATIESEILTAFLVMHTVLHCLELCKNNIVNNNNKDEISERINQIKLKLINMKNRTLQIELLENIFALLFLQGQLLTITSETTSNFDCSEKEVRLILMLLKSVCDEMKRKNLIDKGIDEFIRLTKLNKIITDGLWRLEIITDSNNSGKLQTNIIKYLLAPPEALIHLSLKQNNFNKADQVIQIFNLQDSQIASEINYNANFINLKQKLRKTFRMQQIKKENAEINMEVQSIGDVVEDYFISNANVDDNFNFLNLIDLLVTLPMSFIECNELLEITYAYSNANTETQYLNFFKTISDVFTEINTRYPLSIKDILCDTQFDLNAEQCQLKESFFSQLAHLCDIFYKQSSYSNDGILNEKHPIHKTYIKLHQLFFSHYVYEGKEQIKYLQRLFNYLKGFSKVLYIEHNNSDIISHNKNTSFFEILDMGRSEVLEKLIFDKNLDIGDFEQLFLKLKLDLIYHVAAIFFPNISLTKSKDNCLSERKPARDPNRQIILYIQKRNWLLAYILNEMYNGDEFKLDLSEVRVKTFINYLKLTSVQKLRPLYDNNQVITSLHHIVNLPQLKSYIDEHTVKYEVEDFDHPNFLLGSQASTESLETAEEIFEGGLTMTNWKHLFDIIDNIPQKDLLHNAELIKLHDMILTELVGDCFEIDYFKYAQLIIDDYLRCQCIFNNHTTWPGDFCINIMKSELSRFSAIDEESKTRFKILCKKIELCEKIRQMLMKDTWFEVLLLCNEKPYEILHSLLNTVQIDFLLQFIDTFEVDTEVLEAIDENYFVTLFDSSVNYSTIEELLQELSAEHLTAICCNLLTMLKKLEHLNFVVNFMANSNLTDDNNSTIRDIKISLKMISCFTTIEQEYLWCLISDPTAIIEILIMNTKLEKLGEVLDQVRPYIQNCEFDESKLSVEKIDEILRCYAEKSLEFRVVLRPESKFVKSPESSKLLQSLDSINFINTTKYFVMPETVPKKSEWVENFEVTECMCCIQTTFSMFNRRHHCRRCGRVICGACSLKRMQVLTYEDIPVRVCLDCFEQSHINGACTSSSKSEVSQRSLSHDYWLLTNDAAHNQIIREEFSFEYAPSVSLCLAILKYHSKTEEYPKFLLNQCDGMLRLLQPVNSSAMEEIDYLLVIKMLKSLAVAAKMLSAQCMLQWGTSLADRILSQADLLELLAERDCLHLIPTPTPNQICYIDANTLRRLRDKLLEREQWNLSLEVSTKAGLDNTGVFAAWGKSYLKAGSLLKAREKFQRCFEKAAHYDTSTELSSSFSSMQLSCYRTKTLNSENRPMKNPPLLNEILNILESNPTRIDPRILKDVKNCTMSSSTCSLNSSATSMQNDPAIFILNKLKNLNRIVAGNYDAYTDTTVSTTILNISKPYLEPLFYEECLYYLNKYGSHASVLEFYIRHGRFCECLKYMLEHRLSSDYFIEIYMLCLRENYVNAIHEAMSMIDSTLDIWKDYLKHICRYLEKQSNLNSLYQLQQFMGDFIRAALTCIKFYKDDAVTYTELTLRVDYLHKAQEHLQQELDQEQWVEVASVRKSIFDEQESFEAKGIANSSLVMKVDSKNIDKHINTISRQIQVAKFLADCESSATPILQVLPDILPFINEDASSEEINKIKIPTLFGSYYERVQLAVLAIVCGNNVDDGFTIAFSIINDHKLNPVKVYCQAGKQLAKSGRYNAIAQLVSCIKCNGNNNTAVTDMCDEMLVLAIQTLTKANATGPQLDGLIKLITDRAAKISAYIESKQLKTAYLLAVKHKRMGDIRRILRESELLNQPNIKALNSTYNI